MSDAGAIAVGFTVGLVAGAAFFGGLWWTVRGALSSRNPALWFALSYLLRMFLLAGGLYAMARHDPVQCLAAAGGVIVARLAVLKSWPDPHPGISRPERRA